MTALEVYKLLGGWRGIGGLIGMAVLSVLLVIQKGETRHWHKQSDQFEKLYHEDQAAFAKTVSDYRAAAEKARADDKANADRVLAEQKAINERSTKSYEARLADARARAERLRTGTPAANPSGPGTTPVPGSNPAPGGPNDPSPQAGLPPGDDLIATEQAIQLDELQRWVKSIVGINRTGTVSSPSSLTGSH
jgi:hypothetical protein